MQIALKTLFFLVLQPISQIDKAKLKVALQLAIPGVCDPIKRKKYTGTIRVHNCLDFLIWVLSLPHANKEMIRWFTVQIGDDIVNIFDKIYLLFIETIKVFILMLRYLISFMVSRWFEKEQIEAKI